jgi:hypothetical protein
MLRSGFAVMLSISCVRKKTQLEVLESVADKTKEHLPFDSYKMARCIVIKKQFTNRDISVSVVTGVFQSV